MLIRKWGGALSHEGTTTALVHPGKSILPILSGIMTEQISLGRERSVGATHCRGPGEAGHGVILEVLIIQSFTRKILVVSL
jgi:hypothetical protein